MTSSARKLVKEFWHCRARGGRMLAAYLSRLACYHAVVLSVVLWALPAKSQQATYSVCRNMELMKALAYVYYGCGAVCSQEVMKALDDGPIDKPTLLGVLGFVKGEVKVVHVFFPLNESRLTSALDWDINGDGSKEDDLRSLKIAAGGQGMLFVLGKASTVGDRDYNIALSKSRMQGVRDFLVDTVKVDCPTVKGGWFGSEAFQFSKDNAETLGIKPRAYRNLVYTLNQAVHVVFVPCSKEALFVVHRGLVQYHYRLSLGREDDASPSREGRRSSRGASWRDGRVASKREERERNRRIATVLLKNDENSDGLFNELCKYCNGSTRDVPVGFDSNTSRSEACALAKLIPEDPRLDCARVR